MVRYAAYAGWTAPGLATTHTFSNKAPLLLTRFIFFTITYTNRLEINSEQILSSNFAWPRHRLVKKLCYKLKDGLAIQRGPMVIFFAMHMVD